MKAPFTLSSAIEKAILVVAFLPLVSVVYPETVAVAHAAQNPEQNALVFEVNSKAKTETLLNQNQLTYDELLQNQPCKNEILVNKVRAYLETKRSPLAPFADKIVCEPQWQRALAISFVESNFCRVAANNNCGSIGVKPGHKLWRKYANAFEGWKDMTLLLERPIYKQKYTTCKSMMGVYVVPGSPRWLNGCNKVSNELLAITAAAEQEKLALANLSFTASVNEVALVK